MEKLDVVVVGACNIDQIAYAPRLPLPGETIQGYKYEVGFGGKGANQCIAAAKLGAKTAMVAKVGNDDNGHRYLKNMGGFGVDVRHISITNDDHTGVAPITVGADGSNSIVILPGANMLLSIQDVENAENSLSNSKVLLCQLETKMETTLRALKLAKKSGVYTIFNPAPAVPDLSSEFFKYTDIICPNETEATLLTGIDVVDITSAFSAAKKLVSMGCDTCVITLGKNGCILAQKEGDPIHVPVPGEPVDAVDTTGAGDAFLGALAYFMCCSKHLGLKEILNRACIVGAKSVLGKGTQSSFPTRKDLPASLFS